MGEEVGTLGCSRKSKYFTPQDIIADTVSSILKPFWEEPIIYFPFTTISVSDTSRKKKLVCTCNEVNKTILQT
jgi:hypothetical protein